MGTCVRCGDFFCDACASEGRWCRACGERGARLPWLDRSETGRFKAGYLTIKSCVTEPRRFATALATSGSVFEACLFGVLCALVGLAIPSGLLGLSVGVVSMFTVKGPKSVPLWIGLFAGPFYLLSFLSMFVVGAFALALALKISTKLCSIPMRYGALVRIIMYTSMSMLIVWLPMIGIGAWVLQLVLMGMAIAAHTRASHTRAAVALLSPVAVALAGFGLMYAGMMWFAISNLKAATP